MSRPAKARNEQIIIEMLAMLEAGRIYNEVRKYNDLHDDWQLKHNTFVKCWKEAQTRYMDAQRDRQQAVLNKGTQDFLERVQNGALTKQERLEIASKIARGEAWRVGNTVIMPNANERIRALDYISKIEGDYAPVKVDEKQSGEVTVNIVRG